MSWPRWLCRLLGHPRSDFALVGSEIGWYCKRCDIYYTWEP